MSSGSVGRERQQELGIKHRVGCLERDHGDARQLGKDQVEMGASREVLEIRGGCLLVSVFARPIVVMYGLPASLFTSKWSFIMGSVGSVLA